MAATRPRQAAAEAQIPPSPAPEVSPDFVTLMERLRTAVAERPGDLQGHVLLARNEAALGNFAPAHAAQARVLELKGAAATAGDWADYADLLILAAGGYVSPEAEAALEQALARDPANGTARYYVGLMQMQIGRPDRGFRIWEALLRESGSEAPWVEPIRAQIEEAAFRAGVDYSLPPLDSAPVRGPSAADVAAAGEMTAEDRMAMIENMVQGLSERLATEGGPPEDWARLIRALGVLRRTDEAAAIWAEAQRVFTDQVALIPVLQAARDAGVAQ
jgi:cytochrome c-type biogenesis protein CcmH